LCYGDFLKVSVTHGPLFQGLRKQRRLMEAIDGQVLDRGSVPGFRSVQALLIFGAGKEPELRGLPSQLVGDVVDHQRPKVIGMPEADETVMMSRNS
jgi:hypothetical protein